MPSSSIVGASSRERVGWRPAGQWHLSGSARHFEALQFVRDNYMRPRARNDVLCWRNSLAVGAQWAAWAAWRFDGLLAGPGLAPSEQLACRLAPPEASSNRLNACAERNPHATHDELEPIKALIKIAEGVERLGAAVLDAVGANVFETL